MYRLLSRLCREEDGGELLEYVLIAALIVIAAVAAVKVFSSAIHEKFGMMGDSVGG